MRLRSRCVQHYLMRELPGAPKPQWCNRQAPGGGGGRKDNIKSPFVLLPSSREPWTARLLLSSVSTAPAPGGWSGHSGPGQGSEKLCSSGIDYRDWPMGWDQCVAFSWSAMGHASPTNPLPHSGPLFKASGAPLSQGLFPTWS